jgi:glycosyltransferase involved in cell wall biosynthesis
MRVGLDLTAAPRQLGGAGYYMVELVAALARHGELALDAFVRDEHRNRVGERAPTCRLHAGGSDLRPLRLAWEQAVLPLRVRQAGVDILHSPHYTMPMMAGVPVVVTFHDATFFSHPFLHQPVKVRFFQAAMKLSARRAARIVVVSESAREGILAHTRANPAIVDTVSEGVDTLSLHPPTKEELAAFRSRYHLGGPWIAFLGTLEPRKNLARLVRVFSKVAPEWEGALVLAGRKGWAFEELERGLASAPAGRVRVLGYIGSAERRCLLGGAEVVCYPSIAEGFGLPVLEAMACGTPVMTSNVSATAEVAGEAAELVDPLDEGGIETALRHLLADEARRRALRTAGLARASTFTWDATAKKMVEVYRRAVG